MFLCVFASIVSFAQGSPATSGSLANQVPLSGRTGQSGSVATQQTPIPGTTQSVNTVNSTISVQGPYAQSALGGKPVEGKLSLREAIGRGLEYNLGTLGLSNAALQAHGQMRVARSSLLPNLNGSLREVAQQSNLASQGLRLPGIPKIVGPYSRRRLSPGDRRAGAGGIRKGPGGNRSRGFRSDETAERSRS